MRDEKLKFICWGCSTPLSKNNMEKHHWLPGISDETIPLCISCHDLVDRIPLKNWSIDLYWGALYGLSVLPRPVKLAGLKFLALTSRTEKEKEIE